MAVILRSRTLYLGAGIIAASLVAVASSFPATTIPQQTGLSLYLRANSQQIRVWDCLLLKYVIRNNSSTEVVPMYPTEYRDGRVAIEVRREPETVWCPHVSFLARVRESPSGGPGPKVAAGVARADI